MLKDVYVLQAKVQHINIDGLGRTKNDFVAARVKNIFKASNFEEVLKGIVLPKSKYCIIMVLFMALSTV